MELIQNIFEIPLGYIMSLFYKLINNYGLTIIVFTLFTKFILFPISIMIQKNSIKMIKLKPELDAIKFKYTDDPDKLFDEQNKLYKKEKYNPFLNVLPLLLQIPIILALINIINRPIRYLLNISDTTISALVNKTLQILGTTEISSSQELMVIRNIIKPENLSSYLSLQNVELIDINVSQLISQISSINMNFFGIDLSAIPTLGLNISIIIPILSAASTILMCFIQNKINVLQIEQNNLSKNLSTAFITILSTYFTFIVPAGVGLYWIFGNLFSIPVMYAVNIIYSPKKYIDYNTLQKLKESIKESTKKENFNKKLSKKYYKQLKKDQKLQKIKILFYSESNGYYKYFENIIKALLEKTDEPIYYITSDPQDSIFSCNSTQIKPYYLDGYHLITFMMNLDAQIVVMTLPDLEKYHIKRSKVNKNIEYVYVDHACNSLNLTYRTGAFDYYDTIFIVSRNQGAEIRAIEKLRNTRKKRIVKIGYGLIDNLIQSYRSLESTNNYKPTILIAPSWQEDNILDSCIDNILKNLISDKYNIIVRPHPQYIKRFPIQTASLQERYKNKLGPNFKIETDFSSNKTIYTADLVITDWSSIGFEFSCTTNKPTLYINTQMKTVNKDYDKINIEPIDITARNILGKSINKEETINISQFVEELLNNKENYKTQIEEFKNEYFYNLGHSGEVGADYIIKRLES